MEGGVSVKGGIRKEGRSGRRILREVGHEFGEL
jgi:hypothetical protein